MRRILSALAVTVIALGATSKARSEQASREPSAEKAQPANAEDPSQVRGPFRVIRAFEEIILMAEGAAPAERPDKPIELWSWVFLPEMDKEDDLPDTSATRYLVNCLTSNLQEVTVEYYLKGELIDTSHEAAAPKSADSATDKLLMGAACDPDFEPKAQIFADLRAARSGAAGHFRNKAGLASLPHDGTSEALRDGGPLRIFAKGQSGSVVYMVAGSLPDVRPDEPVERWMWTFHSEARQIDKVRFDADATRVRVDCTASTIEQLKNEMFLKGRFLKATPRLEQTRLQAKKGTVAAAFLQAVCDSELGEDRRSYADFAAANGATTELFSHKPKTAQASGDLSAPKMGPARKRQPLRLTGSGFERNTSAVYMTEGSAPRARPDQPVEVWDWIFRDKPLIVDGKILGDTSAKLQRVDCKAGTRQSLTVEYYADDKLVHSIDYSKDTIQPTRATERLLGAACDPAFKPDAEMFPSHRTARSAASLIIAERNMTAQTSRQEAKAVSPDVTGEAERFGGPLRVIGRNSKALSFLMAAGSAPKAQPIKPVEIWIWEFSQKTRKVDGRAPYDTWATRMRVDCAANTVRAQLREGYRNGRFDDSWELLGKAQRPVQGHLESNVVAAACDPKFQPGTQRFMNHNTARAAALNTRFTTGSN